MGGIPELMISLRVEPPVFACGRNEGTFSGIGSTFEAYKAVSGENFVRRVPKRA